MNFQKNNSEKEIKKVLAIAVIVSFLVGGVAGGIFGALGGGLAKDFLVPWWKKNVLSQQSVASSSAGQVATEGTIKVEEESATVEVVERVSPAVVSIVGKQDLSEYYDLTGPDVFPFDRYFFSFPFDLSPSGPQGEQQVSAGTGFLISSQGLILTNKHVVSSSGETEYTVITSEGKQYDAEILATDPFNDIALIKVEGENLPVVELGDSDILKIGQTVIAIGYALGEYQNSVTRGVISGLSRTIEAGDNTGSAEVLENTIQTDAAINFGNSGGPLLNLAGQVIGINTAISQEGQLIGFAIPINSAKEAIESVQQHGRIIRPMLGVRYVMINETIAEQNNLPVDYGALLVQGDEASESAVISGGPADKAGLEEDDIILEFNGQTLDQDHPLSSEIKKYKVDDEVELKVLHDGEEKTVKVKLTELE